MEWPLPIDVERVFSTPLSKSDDLDSLRWVASSDGVFRVRDAYKLALSASILESSSVGSDPIWMVIWRLNIPPKAKIFLWRTLGDILPHGANLRKKGIEGVGPCVRCRGLEDNLHVFKDCPWVKEVWSLLLDIPVDAPSPSFKEWFALIWKSRLPSSLELFVSCVW